MFLAPKKYLLFMNNKSLESDPKGIGLAPMTYALHIIGQAFRSASTELRFRLNINMDLTGQAKRGVLQRSFSL